MNYYVALLLFVCSFPSFSAVTSQLSEVVEIKYEENGFIIQTFQNTSDQECETIYHLHVPSNHFVKNFYVWNSGGVNRTQPTKLTSKIRPSIVEEITPEIFLLKLSPLSPGEKQTLRINIQKNGELADPRNIKDEAGRERIKNWKQKTTRSLLHGYWHSCSSHPCLEMIDLRTNQVVSFDQEFQIGECVDLLVKFGKFKTLKISMAITKQNPFSPFTLIMPLSYLKRHEYVFRKDHLEINGFLYPLEIYADGILVEPHLLKKEFGLGRFIWTMGVEPRCKKFKFVAGYKSISTAVKLNRILDFSSYDVECNRLVKHLERLEKKEKSAVALKLKSLLDDPSFCKALLRAPNEQAQVFLHYLEKFPNLSSQFRQLIYAKSQEANHKD